MRLWRCIFFFFPWPITSSNTTREPPDREPGRGRPGKCRVMSNRAAPSLAQSVAAVATPLTGSCCASGSIYPEFRGASLPGTATRDSNCNYEIQKREGRI